MGLLDREGPTQVRNAQQTVGLPSDANIRDPSTCHILTTL